MSSYFEDDSILYGVSTTKGITGIHFDGDNAVSLYIAEGGQRRKVTETFRPFALLANRDLLAGWEPNHELEHLSGGEYYNTICFVERFSDLKLLKNHLKKCCGASADKLLHLINDPVQQYLMQSGNTMFKGMQLEDTRRMQLDIETYSAGGFSNASRETDKIIIISLRESSGWEAVLHGGSEEELISEMIRLINERDPDIIEGHNLFNFDLPYIETRARRYGIRLKLGRDGSTATSYSSRLNIAEKRMVYKKYEIAGRSIIDTFILARMHDVTSRSMESYGLKYLARFFGVAPPDRTYIDGDKIAWFYDNDPETLLQYAVEDVRETDGISSILSQSVFYQAKVFPFSYQNIAVKGNAMKIDSIMLRSYLDKRHSVPGLSRPEPFSGGYTDIMKVGVITGRVLNCDVQSLYPSIMLAYKCFPKADRLGIFEATLSSLKTFRLHAKKLMQEADDQRTKDYYNAQQSTFKVLINSYYGYLGSSYGHFVDFQQADRITGKGREIVKNMVTWLQERGAEVIEVDTDGVYFVPPDAVSPNDEERFISEMSDDIDPDITIELAGRYKGMFSYKMKNYVLLDFNDRLFIKGSGLRSRGLELFQRRFMEEMFGLMLSGRSAQLPGLYEKYLEDIRLRKLGVNMFQKKETLRETLSAYKEKRGLGKRNMAASYELAIRNNLNYGPGDQVSYYVTGEKKTVKVAENCRLASEWNVDEPDENLLYYEKKMTDLYKKFKIYTTS